MAVRERAFSPRRDIDVKAVNECYSILSDSASFALSGVETFRFYWLEGLSKHGISTYALAGSAAATYVDGFGFRCAAPVDGRNTCDL